LLLVIAGFAASMIPGLPNFDIDPEIILVGVLPPLLYATAVNVPTLDLRRNWGAITGLSVLLVIGTSLVFGVILNALLPGLGLAPGIAAGAVMAPTGTVATMVAKKLRAPHRVITMLEGEGLLNDATALVVLRTAIVATAATASVGNILARFAWYIIGAIICGAIIGALGIIVRRLVALPELTTAITFVVPFAAFIAAEAIGASGEFSVVIAGLLTGIAALRFLQPQDRQYGQYNWLTIATVLEGALFFLMGLELSGVLTETGMSETATGRVVLLAVLSGAIALAVRAVFVFPLLMILNHSRRRSSDLRDRLEQRLPKALREMPWNRTTAGRVGTTSSTTLRRIADADYRMREPLGIKEGLVVLWAGMRGAVTIAAAQTLPRDFPYRSILVLMASVVAVGTLLIQGFTLPIVMKWLSMINHHRYRPGQILALRTLLKESSDNLLADPHLLSESGEPYDPEVLAEAKESLLHEPALMFIEEEDDIMSHDRTGEVDPAALAAVVNAKPEGPEHKSHTTSWERIRQFLELRRRVFAAQHETLLDAGSLGTHDSEAITRMFNTLDAEQMAVELRMETVDAAL